MEEQGGSEEPEGREEQGRSDGLSAAAGTSVWKTTRSGGKGDKGNDYMNMKNAELEVLLKSRSLPHSGKKADKVARLLEDDKNKESR